MNRYVTRLALAYLSLVGRFDGVTSLVETVADLETELAQARKVEMALRKAIETTQTERSYWYTLWFRMGTEFEGAQSALIDEIDELSRKIGMDPNLASKRRALFEKSLEQTAAVFVRPTAHPSPAVRLTVPDANGDEQPLDHVACPPEDFAG